MKPLFKILCAMAVLPIASCSDDETSKGCGEGNGQTSLCDARGPKRNPFLASDLYSITHFNSAQTDAFP